MAEVRKAHLELLLPHYASPRAKQFCGIDKTGEETRSGSPLAAMALTLRVSQAKQLCELNSIGGEMRLERPTCDRIPTVRLPRVRQLGEIYETGGRISLRKSRPATTTPTVRFTPNNFVESVLYMDG